MSTSPDPQGDMPLWQHLDELRGCLFRVITVLGIAVLVTFQFSEQLVFFLQKPLLEVLPDGAKQLYYTGIADKFVIYIKVSLLAAIAATSPYILFQIWKFVSPGLYQTERKLVIPFIILGTVSFLLGLAFCYFVLLPYSFQFLINFGGTNDKAIITLSAYFGLTIKMLMGVGLLFEFPIVLLLLAFMGLVDAALLRKFRKHAIVVMLILSAIITPPDVVSQFMVGVPLWILYELCILGVTVVHRKRAEEEAKDDEHNEIADEPSEMDGLTPRK